MSRTCPSAATDLGGVKVNVNMKKVVEESASSCSGCDTPVVEYETTDYLSLRVSHLELCIPGNTCFYYKSLGLS